MAGKTLDELKFSYCDHTLIGSLKASLDFLGIDVSEDWLYGMTGIAFLIVTDEKVSTDAVAYGYEPGMVFRLAENLGIRVKGIHRVEDPHDREGLIQSAWSQARRAIDSGYPCFSFELEEQHEHAIVFGYNETGYLTHGWHQRGTRSIPWELLGQSMCPCERCEDQRNKSNVVPTKSFIDLHWVEPGPKEDPARAFEQMLSFVLAVSFERLWVYRGFDGGSSAYDHLIQAVEEGTAIGKHIGYNLSAWSEARSHAPGFLEQVHEHLEGNADGSLDRATAAYRDVAELLEEASELYPWRQPMEPVGVNETSRKAAALLKREKDAEINVLDALKELHNTLNRKESAK
ncbi:MAG TPA: hypothetical protein VFT51_01865 [Bacillales bacterium]|nr:hypothetical protein [Bacillales bacterium]